MFTHMNSRSTPCDILDHRNVIPIDTRRHKSHYRSSLDLQSSRTISTFLIVGVPDQLVNALVLIITINIGISRVTSQVVSILKLISTIDWFNELYILHLSIYLCLQKVIKADIFCMTLMITELTILIMELSSVWRVMRFEILDILRLRYYVAASYVRDDYITFVKKKNQHWKSNVLENDEFFFRHRSTSITEESDVSKLK